MKSTTSNTLTEYLLYDVIGGASPKPRIKTEYFSDVTSTWESFADVEGRSLNISTENKRYASYSFMPPVKEMKLTLNNFWQIYSTGSGNPKASILKKNLKVRCWSGYQVIPGLTSLYEGVLANTAKLYHTKIEDGKVVMDIASTPYSTIATAAELGGTVMGTTTYGNLTYGYAAYYSKTFKITDEEDPGEIDINVTSDNFSFKWRVSKHSDFNGATWSDYIPLVAGDNSIIIKGEAYDEYVQFICRFNSSTWDITEKINSIGIRYGDIIQLFKRGTFIIDEPNYNDKVSISGRDYLKKALETEINLPDLTATKTVTDRLTEVFDRCSIPYNTSEWDVISTTCLVSNATIAESLSNKSAWKVCDLLMDAINAGDDDIYFTFNEDGRAVIKRLETDVEADWTTHYKYNIESVSKNFDSDSQLQRCTVLNKSITVDSEITLGSFTGTTSGNSLHLSYGTTAMYVRYTDVNEVILNESSRTNTGIDFDVAATASSYNIKVYGCHPKSVAGGSIWEESGNSNNILNNEGSTYKRVNPFMDNSKAKAFADYIIDRNGDPRFNITVKQQVNPLLEVGIDNIMVFDKYSFTDSIYGLQGISETWNNPSLKEVIKLRDRGFDLTNFIWSRKDN